MYESFDVARELGTLYEIHAHETHDAHSRLTQESSMTIQRLLAVICLLVFTLPHAVLAEEVTIVTYNIENFRQNFLGHRMQQRAATRPFTEPEVAELIAELRAMNDEDNWEVSQVIRNAKVNPDILVIQECANQSDLEFFNTRWLGKMFETVRVFPSNTTRDQHLAILLKPGFKIIEERSDYHRDPDPAQNARGDRLFARGPAFVLVETPGGYRFWVGTTHQKSKADNSVENTKWRNREARRTHEIIRELEQTPVKDVMLLGDFNDELGIQEFELEGGGDTIANIVGPPEHGLVLVTQKLAESSAFTFGGYWNDRRRNFIDHCIVTKSMEARIADVSVYMAGFAPMASDHYPVVVKINTPASAPATRPGN